MNCATPPVSTFATKRPGSTNFCLANLLSPIGGGRLSQNVSQQEYSSLFQADGLGIANSTLGRSDNKSVTELASQYGTFGGTSYAFDLDYQHNGGVRPNNGLDSIEWYTHRETADHSP